MRIKPIDLFKKFLDKLQHNYTIEFITPTEQPTNWDGFEYEYTDICLATCKTCPIKYKLILTKVVNYVKVNKVGHTYEIRTLVPEIGSWAVNSLLFGFEGEYFVDDDDDKDGSILLPDDWFIKAYKVAREKKNACCTKLRVMQ